MSRKRASSTNLSRRSAIAAAAGLAFAAGRGNSARAQPAVGDLPDAAAAIQQVMPGPAPDLHFTDAAGKRLSLASYRGSGLLVNIWATWCGPCVAELPTIAAIAAGLARSRILVLPISIDTQGSKAVAPFYASHGIRGLPILLDPDGSTPQALNASGIPVTILLNARGQLVGRLDGSANWNSPATLALVRQLAGGPADPDDTQPA